MTEPGTRELDRAASPGSSVACPLKGGAQIGNGRCVEWQRDNGCHCGNALVALRRVEEHLVQEPLRDGGKVDNIVAVKVERIQQLEQVRGLIARAEQIEKARPEVCGNCGRKPGDRAPDGKLVLHMRCQRVDCESIHCTACLNDGTAHPRIENQRPAQPAKENDVARFKMDPCAWPQGCTAEVRAGASKSGLCTKHRRLSQKGDTAPQRHAPANGGGSRCLPLMTLSGSCGLG